MDNNAFIKQQLTFNGTRSRCEEQYLTVLVYIAEGIWSRLAISYAMNTTISQVSSAVAWLQGRGYVMLDMEGQISRVTVEGQAVAKARIK